MKNEIKIDFDTLTKKVIETDKTKDLDALFGAYFELPEWNFILRGEFPDVTPYIATNASVAGGKPLIRAFTDTERLMRLAKEDNLVDANGKCEVLSIPTDGIVEYLEKFIPLGVHGIWFNSDSESFGYFVSLKQLQPIKEHLAKKISQKKFTRQD